MHRRPFGPLVEKRFASLHKAIEVASGLAISPPERSKRQYQVLAKLVETAPACRNRGLRYWLLKLRLRAPLP